VVALCEESSKQSKAAFKNSSIMHLNAGERMKAKCKPATQHGSLCSREMTITQSFHTKKLYDKGGVQYRHITHQLAMFVGCTHVPNCIVEALNFRNW